MPPGFEEITSLHNRYVKLANQLKKKRERKKEDLFLIEGFKEISLAIEASYQCEAIFYCPLFFSKEIESWLHSLNIQCIKCSEAVFKKMAYRENPDGVLAIAKPKNFDVNDLMVNETSFYLIAETIEKPGNLGAILRSADAAGAAGVIVVDERVDIYHPNVIRSSVGAIFCLPVVSVEKEKVIQWLKRHEIVLIAASPEAEEKYDKVKDAKKCAFVVGSEHQGLSKFWKERADHLVKIPMSGKMDSLNVAISATLLLFEARRWNQ